MPRVCNERAHIWPLCMVATDSAKVVLVPLWHCLSCSGSRCIPCRSGFYENFIRYYFYQPLPDGSYVVSNNAGKVSWWHSTEAIASAALGTPKLCCRGGRSALCVTVTNSALLQSGHVECRPPYLGVGDHGCQQCSELGTCFLQASSSSLTSMQARTCRYTTITWIRQRRLPPSVT